MLDNFGNNTYGSSISWMQRSDGFSVIHYIYISYLFVVFLIYRTAVSLCTTVLKYTATYYS